MENNFEEKAAISAAVMGGENVVQTDIVDMVARMFDSDDDDED